MSDSTETPSPERHRGGQNLLVPDVERWAQDAGPCVRLTDVHKSFGDEVVLDGLTLDIEPGEITAILGRSGSGKTVLVKHINGLVRPDSGKIELLGVDIADVKATELDALRKRVGTLFQNYALFDSMTVVENVSFPLVENNAMKIGEARELAASLLEDLGLGDVLDAYPASLSGGMKKRVSVARSIVWNPEMLLLDDPTTGLDPILTQFVDEMLIDVTREFELTTIMVSHNLTSIFRMADRIAVLHDGTIVEDGTPAQIMESDNEAVRALVNKVASAKIASSGVDLNATDPDAEDVVRIRDVHKSFGPRHILKGINLTAKRGEISVIIGGSGAGKSVMMKHLLGLMRADSGEVWLFGNEIGALSDSKVRSLRTRIGMLFQHSALLDSLTVLENVAFPLVERGEASRSEAHEKAREMLASLKLEGIESSLPSEISNGQQKRVSLARALISEPEVVIYDEPTTGQDPIMADYVEEMILEAQEEFGLTCLIISHDMAATMRIADRVALLHQGEIILEGPPQAFLDSEDSRVRDFVFASQFSEPTENDSDTESGSDDSRDSGAD